MGFWSTVRSAGGPTTPNENGPQDYSPGDPSAFEITGAELEQRSLPIPIASPWDGWPGSWETPNWQTGINKLVDIAWACLDLNSNIVSAMPVYRLQGGKVVDPKTWMLNPDPAVYTCWQEFAKQLFWDYQMGEAFVMPMVTGSDGYPAQFRVIPPWLVTVELVRGQRVYMLGDHDVTGRILHVRYQSSTVDARGRGPLDVAGLRMTQVALLQRYANTLAETGGVPLYWIGVERKITPSEGRDLIDSWVDSRIKNVGRPAVLGSNATLNQAKTMDAKEMALLELSQFSESRIAVLLGVPPFLVGLAGAAGSLTYSNIADLFDFHDRSSLRPKTLMVMESLSGWALPSTQNAEVNRDDYTRLPLDKRAAIYKTLIELEVLTTDEVRIMERYYGTSSGTAAQALSGGTT